MAKGFSKYFPMKGVKIQGSDIKDLDISGADLADGTITAVKLAANAVETAKIKDANVTAAKLAADVIATVAELTLTNAQMLALRATPIQAIAAPAAGKSILVLRVGVKCDAMAGVYTETDDNISVQYGDATEILLIETTGAIDQGGAVQYRTQAPVATVVNPVPASKVQLKNSGDGEFGGGNVANTFKVSIAYLVL